MNTVVLSSSVRTEVTTVVVYASDPVRKVIGEFDIEEILHDEPQAL